MRVTGLRSRFFAIILGVLTIVSAGTVGFHSLFLYQERMAHIDQQVRETAAALIDSELGDLRRIDFEHADQIISDELGENRIGKFFIIRNQAGATIFESTSAKVLPIAEVPRHPQWLTIEGKGQFIRVLNLGLPRVPDRTLQVGLVIDEALLEPRYLSRKSLVFIGSVVSLGLLVSWFLTSTLLRPIRKLEGFISEAAAKSSTTGTLPAIPAEIKGRRVDNSRDEFQRLLAGLDRLIERINRNHKLSRFWTYQMAHELKTPLAIIGVELEKGTQTGTIAPETANAIEHETRRISNTVNSFLSWAELENSERPRDLYANRVGKIALEAHERLRHAGTDRLRCAVERDFYVLANPQHLEQAIMNLVVNALAYSPESEPVEIRVDDSSLTVTDRGRGIPQSVLDRMGEPFNRGGESSLGATSINNLTKSHGLGLAWVRSLARIYGWRFDLETGPNGTKAKLIFPEQNEDVSPD